MCSCSSTIGSLSELSVVGTELSVLELVPDSELSVDGTELSVVGTELSVVGLELSVVDEPVLSVDAVLESAVLEDVPGLLDEPSVSSSPPQAAKHIIKPASKREHNAKYKIFFIF